MHEFPAIRAAGALAATHQLDAWVVWDQVNPNGYAAQLASAPLADGFIAVYLVHPDRTREYLL